MRFKVAFGALITAFLTVSAVSGQGAPTLVFDSQAEGINIALTITNKRGVPIPHITMDDIRIYDNSVEQKPLVWQEQTPGTDYILMIDNSRSMGEPFPMDAKEPSGGRPLATVTKKAARKFIRALRTDDQMMVLAFADKPTPFPTADGGLFTNDSTFLEASVQSIVVGGMTRLYQSLYTVLKEYLPASDPANPRRTIIILITDGEDTASLVTNERVLEEASQGQAIIYSIETKHNGIGSEIREQARTAHVFLETLTRDSGGRNILVNESGNLEIPVALIANELARQYWLGYQPTSDSLGRHEIKVIPRGHHPDWILRHRTGYFVNSR